MRETSASKPLLTHRKRIRRRQNRRRASLPGTAWKIAYLLSMRRPVCRKRDSHAGFRTELENLIGDGKRKGTSGSNREAESIDAPIRVGLLHCSSPPACRPTANETLVSHCCIVGIELRRSAPLVIDGPINGDWFLAYVEQVLAPTLSEGDI